MNQLLTPQQRMAIRERLIRYCRRYPSRNIAAHSLKNVSASTISCIINEKWNKVNDRMLMNISWQIGSDDGWKIVETSVHQRTTFALRDAQEFKRVHWVVGAAGSGKSTAAKAFCDNRQDVCYMLCAEDMKKTEFLRELARQIGVPEYGFAVRDMLYVIINSLSERKAPLLIFDEADKLTDSVLSYFITIYNYLEDKVGIVFLSTSYIVKRIENGLRYNKRGYQELHSRIGRKFLILDSANANEVYAICQANGLAEKEIKRVIEDASKSGFDLRRVKKMANSLKKAKEVKRGTDTIG